MLFFELLVMVLDKASNNRCPSIARLDRKLITGLHTTDCFSIDKQDAFEHPVLAHQVFGWCDRYVVLCGCAGLSYFALRIAASR
jgi:hypothetical protein